MERVNNNKGKMEKAVKSFLIAKRLFVLLFIIHLCFFVKMKLSFNSETGDSFYFSDKNIFLSLQKDFLPNDSTYREIRRKIKFKS